MISNAIAVGIGTVTAACAIENRDAERRNQGVAQVKSSDVRISIIYFVIFDIV